ncbi:MAG: hypothetical protein ACRBCI_07155 [Cellvibrionaceae bacterium]
MNKLYLFLLIILSVSCAQADNVKKQPHIPLAVAELDSFRIGNEIVRVIRSYPDYSPVIYIERIATPEFALLESLAVNSVTLKNGEQLSFTKNISGVYADKVVMKDKTLHIAFEYFPEKGNGFLINCTLAVSAKSFSNMECIRQKDL